MLAEVSRRCALRADVVVIIRELNTHMKSCHNYEWIFQKKDKWIMQLQLDVSIF